MGLVRNERFGKARVRRGREKKEEDGYCVSDTP